MPQADHIAENYPYPPPPSPSTPAACQLSPAAAPATNGAHTEQLELANHQLLQQILVRLEGPAAAAPSSPINVLVHPLPISMTPAVLSLTAPEPTLAQVEAVSARTVLTPSGRAANTVNAPKPNPTSLKHRELVLGNGCRLRFMESEVPDPPAVSFTENVPRLNAMWDDTSPYWNRESVVSIQGHPIALVYWPDVYKYWRGDQWKGTKARWCDWKDLVHCYRKGTPSEFWERFSVDGKTLSFTAIIAILRSERMVADAVLAEQVREEYGEDFEKEFSYRRGSERLVMSKPCAIAKQYRKLKNLPHF